MPPQMKIVVKVPMCDDKCRTKALKIAAAARGVSKVSIEGDYVEVIGDDVDSVCLTRSLRKKFGCSCTIVKVEEVKPPKPEVKPQKPEVKPPKPAPSTSCVQHCCTPQFRPMYCEAVRPMYCEVVHEYPEPTICSIM